MIGKQKILEVIFTVFLHLVETLLLICRNERQVAGQCLLPHIIFQLFQKVQKPVQKAPQLLGKVRNKSLTRESNAKLTEGKMKLYQVRVAEEGIFEKIRS